MGSQFSAAQELGLTPSFFLGQHIPSSNLVHSSWDTPSLTFVHHGG